MTGDGGPLGYDTGRVEDWLRRNVEALHPPLRWTRLEGGHSNLTYLLEDSAGSKAVIRRPPLGQLLPRAHEMSREFALISALGPTAVPVPPAIAFCDDVDVTGAQFYVMGFVEGHALFSREDADKWVAEENRLALAHTFIDVLAELHALEPDEVGLGNLGKKDGYIARQIDAWYRSWLASAPPAQFDDHRAHTLHEFFLENVPEQGPARIVHGDYSIRNCLTRADGTIGAVLDWEISTLGDPLADLAYALNEWPDPSDPPGMLNRAAATSARGFPHRNELAQRYRERTGRDLSRLDYYLGFNRWKSAAITHGVYARYKRGQKGTEGVALEQLRLSIEHSLDLAEQAVQRLRS